MASSPYHQFKRTTSTYVHHLFAAALGVFYLLCQVIHRFATVTRTRLSTYVMNAGIAVVKQGPVPKHVAFIMDGNRRYAKRLGVPIQSGHASGFDAMMQALECCLDLGINTVTVFAFSIDNNNRTSKEVADLMELCKLKFQGFIDKKSVIMQKGIRIRILGDASVVREDVRKIIGQVTYQTRNNTNATLNICFSYSSSEEVSRAVDRAKQVCSRASLPPSSITQDTLSALMYTRGDHPELLVRTSGETRLSNFLIWQCKHTHLCFLNVLWPDLTWRHVLSAILDYQSQAQRRKNDPHERLVLDRQWKAAIDAANREQDAEMYAMRLGGGARQTSS